jgi:hypothetical protein
MLLAYGTAATTISKHIKHGHKQHDQQCSLEQDATAAGLTLAYGAAWYSSVIADMCEYSVDLSKDQAMHL